METTLDQKRAAHALTRVQTVLENEGGQISEYRSYVRQFPMLLRQNGLGQAIALKMAQSSRDGGSAHEQLLDDMLAWLCDKQNGWTTGCYALEPERRNGEELIKKIMCQSEADSLRAQDELMAYLRWLKTFAEALLPPRAEATQHAAQP